MNPQDIFPATRLLTIALLFFAEFSPASAGQPPSNPRPPANRGLVIVVPRRFEAELKPFVEYRRQSLPVEMAILEDVLAQQSRRGRPREAQAILVLRLAEDARSTMCLLVGDATVLPVRYMVLDRVTPAAFDTAFYPSDLYYADVARE